MGSFATLRKRSTRVIPLRPTAMEATPRSCSLGKPVFLLYQKTTSSISAWISLIRTNKLWLLGLEASSVLRLKLLKDSILVSKTLGNKLSPEMTKFSTTTSYCLSLYSMRGIGMYRISSIKAGRSVIFMSFNK